MERDAVISLGAGVQSSTLLLMAAHGELEPMPKLAIFADTGAEPRSVYEHLEFLERTVGERIEIVRVSAGNLRDDIRDLAAGERKRLSNPPVFTKLDGRIGQIPRNCTRDYKIRPIERELRKRGYGKKKPVEQWLGISLDEVQRMKPSQFPGSTTRWPLIEKEMTRMGCFKWLREHGYPTPPKSACTFCPYHSDNAWRELRDGAPEDWEDAVEVDKMLRVLPGLKSEAYVHRSNVPLEEVDLRTAEDRGQYAFDLEDGSDECGGSCFM
jgi:hypothetical protein